MPLMSKNRDVPARVRRSAVALNSIQRERVRTRVALPVKVLLGVAVAAEGQARLLARRAVRKGHVPVGNVVEEVDVALVEHQAGRDGVHGGVAPALIEEATVLVERLEKVNVLLAAQPVEAANLKVGPLETVSG